MPGMSPQHSAGHAGVVAHLMMWMAMMVPMMLPALLPELVRFRRSMQGRGTLRLHGLTLVAAAGYFAVWAGAGVLVWAVTAVSTGALPAGVQSERWIGGALLVLAGGVQLSSWKARQLTRCRYLSGVHTGTAGSPGEAWLHGTRLGTRCSLSCGSLMLAMLVFGMSNIAATVAITLAITAERLAPAPKRVASASGVVLLVVGLFELGSGGPAGVREDARATSAGVLVQTCAAYAAGVVPMGH